MTQKIPVNFIKDKPNSGPVLLLNVLLTDLPNLSRNPSDDGGRKTNENKENRTLLTYQDQ